MTRKLTDTICVKGRRADLPELIDEFAFARLDEDFEPQNKTTFHGNFNVLTEEVDDFCDFAEGLGFEASLV